jgi:hypothetical protein
VKAWLSFSSRGYLGKPNSFIIDLHKVGFYYLKKNFGEVHFLTDSFSRPYFDFIPWDSVSTALDQVPFGYSEVWSLSKLYAYREIAKQGQPFIHVDNDVVLWKGLPENLKEAGVFAQSWEHVGDFGYEPEKLFPNCPNLHVFGTTFSDLAANVGIFGGTNLEFIKDYAEAAIEFVLDPENKQFWQQYGGYSLSWCKAVLAEQWFLATYAKSRGVPITTLFKQWPTEEEAKRAKYTHLMAAKQDPKTRDRVHSLSRRIVRVGDQFCNLGFDNHHL